VDLELDPYLIERKRIIRWRWAIAGVAAALIGCVAWQWNLIWDYARGWRSRRLAAAAEESLARGKYQKAFETAQSAYYLNPGEASAIRAVAHVLDTAGKPADALSFWCALAGLPDAAFEDRQAVAEDQLRIGALEESAKTVASLLAEHPKSASILRLAGRLKAAQGRIPEGLARVRESLAIDPQNPEGRLLAATLLAQSGSEAERKAALESLWQLSADPGPAGLGALEMLTMWRDFPADRTGELISRLRERPSPDERLRLLALDVALNTQPDQKEQILDSVVSEYARKNEDTRRQLGVWLSNHGAPERALILLPQEESFGRKDLILVHLDALASLNRWAEVRQLLERKGVPLEEVYRQVFLARCATQEGDASETEAHWRRARTEAGSEPNLLRFVGDYAERAGELGQAELVYRALARNATGGRPPYDALLRVVSRRGNTSAMRDVLADMNKQFPGDPAIENDLAYFNLLLGREVEAARQTAEQLRTTAPGNLAHRTTLALAFCRLNEPTAALQAYEGLTIPWDQVSPAQRAIHAAAIGLAGDENNAKSEAALLSLDSLRPEERKLLEPWIQP
jgi:tetratricopeptide (TPR) repeat protein